MTAFRFVLVIALVASTARSQPGTLGSASAWAAGLLPDYASAGKGIHTARPS